MYIIAGPNGVGKTTLSYTILPEIFECDEFVNADEIAKGLSPFKPGKASIKAGRIMLERINELIANGDSFAFETTLATKSYVKLVEKAQNAEYEVVLLFLTLDSVDLAKERVSIRVKEGGHNIPIETIERRYRNGLKNLFNLYLYKVDKWILVENSKEEFEYIAEGARGEVIIRSKTKWSNLKNEYNGN